MGKLRKPSKLWALLSKPHIHEAYDRLTKDSEVIRITNAWKRKWGYALDEHDLIEVCDWALVRAIEGHKEGYGRKFTASLRVFLSFETNRKLKKNYNRREAIPTDRSVIPDELSTEHIINFRQADERIEYLWDLTEKYLPADVREIMRDSYKDGLSAKEISRRRNCSKSTVLKQLEMGRAKLKEIVELHRAENEAGYGDSQS